MTIHYLNFKHNTFEPAPAPWINQDPPATWETLGEKFSAIDGTGMSLWVTVAFSGSASSGGLLAQDYHGIPESAWEQWANTDAGSPSTIEIRDVPVPPGTLITVRPFAAVGNDRDLDVITDQGTFRLDHPNSLPPPAAPLDVPVTTNASGHAVVQFSAVTVNAAVAGLIIEYPDGPQAIRKGSQFTVEETLAGTVTSATLNGNAITVNSHVGTTVTLTDTGSGITTSGEYPLVLTDNSATPQTQTITLQVNVVGLPIYNLNKDGADLASLTDVEVLVMTGAAGSRAINQQVATRTTTAAGNTTAYEVTDLALTVDQNVFVVVSSAASGVGVAFTDTLELI